MNVHRKKLRADYYAEVYTGIKTAELRINDCDYQVGDYMLLEEVYIAGGGESFTGRSVMTQITHMLDDKKYLQPGYIMLSFRLMK